MPENDRKRRVPGFTLSNQPKSVRRAYSLVYNLFIRHEDYRAMHGGNPDWPDIVRYIADNLDSFHEQWELPDKFEGYTRGGERLTLDLRLFKEAHPSKGPYKRPAK